MEMSLLNAESELANWSEKPGEHLISPACWERIGEIADLSDRELQVSRLIFQGLTREEVADALSLSPRTIRHYMELLHVKLRVCERISLVLRFIQIRDYLHRQEESQ